MLGVVITAGAVLAVMAVTATEATVLGTVETEIVVKAANLRLYLCKCAHVRASAVAFGCVHICTHASRLCLSCVCLPACGCTCTRVCK